MGSCISNKNDKKGEEKTREKVHRNTQASHPGQNDENIGDEYSKADPKVHHIQT
jgi:hypothetical protein